MFLHLSVILCTGGVCQTSLLWADTLPRADNPRQTPHGQKLPPGQTPPTPGQTTPKQTPSLGRHPHLGRHNKPLGRHPLPLADTPPTDSYCCRRYASYNNAFLLISYTNLMFMLFCILLKISNIKFQLYLHETSINPKYY